MANVEKVEELVRTLDQLQSILSAYPEMMDSKQIQRLELIQRCITIKPINIRIIIDVLIITEYSKKQRLPFIHRRERAI